MSTILKPIPIRVVLPTLSRNSSVRSDCSAEITNSLIDSIREEAQNPMVKNFQTGLMQQESSDLEDFFDSLQ